MPIAHRATWRTLNKPWHEAKREIDTGTLVEFADGERHLVGYMNTNGGYCDCCSVDREAIVARVLDLERGIADLIHDADKADGAAPNTSTASDAPYTEPSPTRPALAGGGRS